MNDRGQPPVLSAESMRALFDRTPANTVGLEDEVVLLSPETFAPAPAGAEVLSRLGADPRFKLELPASQLEITTRPSVRVGEVARDLLSARRALQKGAGGLAVPASLAVHPFGPGSGKLNRGPERYERTIAEHAAVASRQLVCSTQVHVAPGGADRALAVYNAARGYLPWVAALAAGAPFYEGRDSGLASVRPLLCGLLPRQGIPPSLESFDALAAALAFGARGGAFADERTWWWELRLHLTYGTLEFRVPDAQATVGQAAALAAVVQCLVVWLGERHEAGEHLPVAETWRIEQNRWSACRYGVEGSMVDLGSGVATSTRECLHGLLDALRPVARRLDCESELKTASGLVERNGAIRQREIAADSDLPTLTRWLAGRFSEGEYG